MTGSGHFIERCREHGALIRQCRCASADKTVLLTPCDLATLELPEVWEQHIGIRVLDPDGWRVADAPSWETAITFEEFSVRAAQSTVMLRGWSTWRRSREVPLEP